MSRRSLDHTLKLLKALDRASSLADVITTVREHLAGFGVEIVIAGLLPAPHAMRAFDRYGVVMANAPHAWQRRYMARHYALHDPIVAETLRRQQGFGWRDEDVLFGASATGLQVMAEAAELGLREGYTVPLTTIEGALGGISFVGSHLEIAQEHRGMLTLVASYAFGQALLVRSQGSDQPVVLSPRERETLQWTAEGKTDWEIGEIMGISEHGVDSHLRCIRTKLGTRNRAQAVAEGLRRGLIQ